MSALADPSIYVRWNTPWDIPNIAQEQPKREENEETAGEGVHLILNQRNIGIGVGLIRRLTVITHN